MLAVRIHETGGPDKLRVDEVPVPAPRAGEVRLEVAAAGLTVSRASELRTEPPEFWTRTWYWPASDSLTGLRVNVALVADGNSMPSRIQR